MLTCRCMHMLTCVWASKAPKGERTFQRIHGFISLSLRLLRSGGRVSLQGGVGISKWERRILSHAESQSKTHRFCFYCFFKILQCCVLELIYTSNTFLAWGECATYKNFRWNLHWISNEGPKSQEAWVCYYFSKILRWSNECIGEI